MTDYKAIARAISDPENQPHQWNDQDLAKFFVSATDEIERYRKALLDCLYVLGRDGAIEGSLRIVEIVDAALQQKESD